VDPVIPKPESLLLENQDHILLPELYLSVIILLTQSCMVHVLQAHPSLMKPDKSLPIPYSCNLTHSTASYADALTHSTASDALHSILCWRTPQHLMLRHWRTSRHLKHSTAS